MIIPFAITLGAMISGQSLRTPHSQPRQLAKGMFAPDAQTSKNLSGQAAQRVTWTNVLVHGGRDASHVGTLGNVIPIVTRPNEHVVCQVSDHLSQYSSVLDLPRLEVKVAVSIKKGCFCWKLLVWFASGRTITQATSTQVARPCLARRDR